MKFNIPRPRFRARLVRSLMMASAVSLLAVASASAQAAQPPLPVNPVSSMPTKRSVLPGLPSAPGSPPATGVPLDQVQAAIRALSVANPTPSTAPAAAAIDTSAFSRCSRRSA